MDIHGYTVYIRMPLSCFAVSSSGLLLASPVEPQALRLAAFFERMASYASLLLACCVGMASMHLVFVAQGSPGSSAPQTPSQVSSAQLPGAPDMEENGMAQTALRFGSGLMLGLVLLAFGQPTFADVEDVVIPVPQPRLAGCGWL